MSVTPHEYRPGSETDFAMLYHDTYPKLLRTLGLMLGDWAEAEDCVQDAYTRAFRAWPRWKPDAPAEAWLWRITLNVARTHIAQRKRRSVGELLRRLGRPEEAGDPSNYVFEPGLQKAMKRLRHRELCAVVMRFLHGYTNVEIAQHLGVDVRTVTRLLTSGSETLRRELGDSWQTVKATPMVEGLS